MHYLNVAIVTKRGLAGNNRGENMGNRTTLQKVYGMDGSFYTSVNAASLRFSQRAFLQAEADEFAHYLFDPVKMTRTPAGGLGRALTSSTPKLDLDLLGYMEVESKQMETPEQKERAKQNKRLATCLEQLAKMQKERAAAEEKGKVYTKASNITKLEVEIKELREKGANENLVKDKKKGGEAKGGEAKGEKRRSPLSNNRATSMEPFRDEQTYECMSGAKEKGALSLHGAEVHSTAYRYSMQLALDSLQYPEGIAWLVDAITDMPAVGGGHARFSYDFSPESVVYCLTQEHAAKFASDGIISQGPTGPSFAWFIRQIEVGDLDPRTLIIGGAVADTEDGQKLASLGVEVVRGVKQARNLILDRVAKLGGRYAPLSGAVGVPLGTFLRDRLSGYAKAAE